MAKNTSVSLGDQFETFVDDRIKAGSLSSASAAVRTGLRLLEQEETTLDLLRNTSAKGETQLDQGRGIDGEEFINELIGYCRDICANRRRSRVLSRSASTPSTITGVSNKRTI